MDVSLPSARKLICVAIRVAPALFLAAALAILAHEIRSIDAAHVWGRLHDIGPGQWLVALLLTGCGYAVLTLYDVLGLRLVGAKLPYRAAAEGAFLSFTISHNVGFGWISGGSMRQRVYGPLGVSLGDVARVTLVNSVTFFIGGFVLLGAALIREPQVVGPLLPLPRLAVQLAGAALWLAIGGYLVLCARRRLPIGWGTAKLPVPAPRIALEQIALSTADIVIAAGVLYILLPHELGIGFPLLLGVYLVALGASVLTHVPGGLGILEALVLWSLPGVPRAPLVAALIAYRIVYYLVPLVFALAWMFGRGIVRLTIRLAGHARQAVPFLMAALSLASGAFLLLAGATPTLDARFQPMRFLVPLPLLELSHLTGSIAGLTLIILAGALYRRYDTARNVAIMLLLAGAAATLLLLGGGAPTLLVHDHGLAGAVALAGAAGALEASGAAFYRHGSLWRNAVTPGWIALGLVAVSASIWVGFRAFADIPYSSDLWWQFAEEGGAPRFLRASLVIGVLGLGLLVARLLGPSREPHPPEQVDEEIRSAVAASPAVQSNLALLGDKRFLRSATGAAFIMYQVEGRSWIAMGDPVGPRDEWPELIWSLRECADVAGGRAVFYEALGSDLGVYSDAGLVAHKVGEEARVELDTFTLEGSGAKTFRSVLRRGERHGLTLEILPATEVPALLEELGAVSRDWLTAKHAVEKGFSMGAFDPAYIARFDCAVVRWRGRIVAFGNIWRGARLRECSMDLMRHRSDAPRGTMMFLMLSLMIHAKSAGFAWFNLGMAPLAGLAQHRLAPRWHAVGRLIFTHGERLYGFGGLRRFKEQFRPVWRPRYVVCSPGMISLGLVLADCTRLISRRPPARSLIPAPAVRAARRPTQIWPAPRRGTRATLPT